MPLAVGVSGWKGVVKPSSTYSGKLMLVVCLKVIGWTEDTSFQKRFSKLDVIKEMWKKHPNWRRSWYFLTFWCCQTFTLALLETWQVVPRQGSLLDVNNELSVCGFTLRLIWHFGSATNSDSPPPSCSAEFDRHELLIYEEVARMPPFRRKTLVLIGAQGVGRRSLKNKLIMSDQSQYGTTIPCESWQC